MTRRPTLIVAAILLAVLAWLGGRRSLAQGQESRHSALGPLGTAKEISDAVRRTRAGEHIVAVGSVEVGGHVCSVIIFER